MLDRGLTPEEVEEDKEMLQQDWEVASVMDFLQVFVLCPIARQEFAAPAACLPVKTTIL